MTRLTEQVSRIAPTLYYGKDFGYHACPDHPQNVIEQGLKLIERVRQAGLTVDTDTFMIASWLHDAGYGLRPNHIYLPCGSKFRPAASKEEVSAYLARCLLTDLGAPLPLIERVSEAILGTHWQHPLTSVEAQVLAAADLHNVGLTDFSTMVANTELLYQEAIRLKGEEIPYPAFVRGCLNLLGRYCARRIHLTPSYHLPDGRSAWHLGAISNLIRLARQTWGNQVRIVIEQALGTYSVACAEERPVFSPDTLLLAAQAPDLQTNLADMVQTHYHRLGAQAPMVAMFPREAGRLSLVDDTVDAYYLSFADLSTYLQAEYPAREITRILRPEGKLHLYASAEGLTPYMAGGYEKALTHFLRGTPLKKDYETREGPAGWELVYIKR